MANLLVMMEFYQGALLPASLETLGQARRLATMLGLSVYALLPLPSQLDHGDDDLTVTCGRHGADKVVMLTGDGLSRESEMRFSSYAGALLNACALLPPRVFMLADSPAARDIAPRLSARLGAAYIARGAIVTDGEQLLFSDASGRRLQVAMEDPSEDGLAAVPTPVVLTVPPGRFAMARGGAEAEMLRRDLAAGLDAWEVKVASAHAKAFVRHVLGHRLIHTGGRNAFGGGVEVVEAGERGKVGEGEHEMIGGRD